jgi:protoporphyrinogen oxidase
MAVEQYDSIVIGGGISGLASAHYAAEQGQRTLLVEKSERPGGCIHTHTFKHCGGFWAELGAHTCYNSYASLLDIMQTCGVLERVEPKAKVSFRMLSGERIVSIPSQLSFMELLVSVPRLFGLAKQGKTVGEYYAKIIGRRNFARVLGPALDAVICQPAAGFPADALFRKRERRKEVTRNFTLPGGIQDIVQAIAERMGAALKTGQEIEAVIPDDSGFLVRCRDGGEWRGRDLVLATPAPVAARLLAQAYPELSRLLSQIAEASIESVAVAVPSEALALPPLAGVIAAEDDFYSAVSRDTRPDPRYRGFCFHFRPNRLDDQQKLARICQVLGIEPEQIADRAGTTNRLPSLALGHADLIAQIDNRLTGGRLGLTGNYFAGVSVEDCVLRSRSEFERLYPSG